MNLARSQKPVHELSCVPEEGAWDFFSKQEDPQGFQHDSHWKGFFWVAWSSLRLVQEKN